MHKLQRGKAPACLAQFKHGLHNWGNVSTADKTDIWTEFRQKGRDPTVTFLWSNLFGSCNREESCGKHKDSNKVNPAAALIKPDVDDPEHYLVFAANGSVHPRQNLTPSEQHRAAETIRIFNLNGALRQIRFREVAGYVQTVEEFAKMANEFPEADWLPLLQQELAATADLPFATAIKHVLTRQN